MSLCGQFMSLWDCFVSLCGQFVSLWDCFVSLCCPCVSLPPDPLGLCPVCPFSNPSMVGKCSQTESSTLLMFLISTLGQYILRRLAVAFCSDHTSLAQQSSQCSLCRRRCDGAPPGHKFVSRRTKVPSAIWGTADPHKA